MHLYLVQTIPTAAFDPPRELALNETFKGRGNERSFIPMDAYTKIRQPIEIISRLNKGDDNISLLDPISSLCDTTRCHISKDGKSLYYNGGHISTFGADQLKPLFYPALEDLRATTP